MNKFIVFFTSLIALLNSNCSQKNENRNLGDGIFAYVDTNKGEIVLKLEYEKAPFTVANFITLAEGKNPYVSPQYKNIHFYDGLTFHRVEENFVIQGGCPQGTGMGNPGYTIKDEFHPDLLHSKEGILSMANSGPNSGGSQFFITLNQTPFLNGKHAIFGEVIEGMDIVKTIAVSDKINSVKIEKKGANAKAFDPVKVFNDYYKKQLEQQKEREVKMSVVKTEMTKLFNAIKTSGTKTTSGLIYKIIAKGAGKKPTNGQEIFVDYAGYFEDGMLFDTCLENVANKFGLLDESRKAQNGYQGFPFQYGAKEGLIPGFIEAIEKVNFGDKIIAYIPYHLGYGEQGFQSIPPKANLFFEITIKEKN